MYITNEQINGNSINITNIDDIKNTKPGIFYIVGPQSMYQVENLYDKILFPVDEIFYFTENIKEHADTIIPHNKIYISIHLRGCLRFK
jgi:hypothetical protein